MTNETDYDYEKSTCSRCGTAKGTDKLAGYDLSAPYGEKYRSAYCVNMLECVRAADRGAVSKESLDNVLEY